MDEQNIREQADKIVERIKEIVKDGSAKRVILKRNGQALMNVSLNTGLLGAVVGLAAAPFTVIAAALVAFGLDCEIEIEKEDGIFVNLNETPVGMKLEELKETVKEKAKETFETQ